MRVKCIPSTFSKPCSSASIPTAKLCAFGAKRVEHPFGISRCAWGEPHFLTKRLPKVAGEMALHVLAYNFTRVMNIIGVKPLMAAMSA